MKQWTYYTPSELKPRGWLLRQLRIQADGLSGNLDKVWPDVKNSAWIGGDGEERERVPYWLDGFVPLAYMLEDEDMIARAKRYIDIILERQQPDGWICPYPYDRKAGRRDTWSVELMSKMLTVYYQCSKDERIPGALYRMLKNFYQLLKSGTVTLANWDKFRWYEALFGINFTYERCHEAWLVDLARILKEQGQDFEELTELWKRPLNRWRYQTHIVGLMMMLKSEAVTCDILGEEYTDKAERLWTVLNRYNNTAIGLITGDECLAGISAIHGTETCGVVEQMFSFETLFAQSGDRKWLDRLDTVVFNAMPAPLTEDMWAHQYLQFANQMALRRHGGFPPFRTNPDGCQFYAVNAVYGCCTSNHTQGWPKFALSAFAHNADTVYNLFPVPSELTMEDKRITVESNYPFEHSVRYTVEAKSAFNFKIRIPTFAENLTVDGVLANGESELNFAITAGEKRVINVQFEATPHFVERPFDLHAVQWGALFFSVPVEYEVTRCKLEQPYYEDEYTPTSDWNYAYCSPKLELEHHPVGKIPFSEKNPPVTIKVDVKKINWGYADGYEWLCAKVPESREPISEAKEIRLIPYGCAKLRMTELPIIE